MNWNIQDIQETYPIVRESALSTSQMAIAKSLLDIRITIPVEGYSRELMHPAVGMDAFRVMLVGKSDDDGHQGDLLVDVFCPVATRLLSRSSRITVTAVNKGDPVPYTVDSYAIVDDEWQNVEPGVFDSSGYLRIHEDCLVFTQGSPTLTWGGAALPELSFKSSAVAPVSYQNDKVTFQGVFSFSIPSSRMLDSERNFPSKGLRSINGMTGTVNFATLDQVSASVSREPGSNVTVLTIKPVL